MARSGGLAGPLRGANGGSIGADGRYVTYAVHDAQQNLGVVLD